MKAIMYHYVRPYSQDFPFFKNLDIEDFKKQLDYFENEFGFVSKEDFISSFKTGILPEGVILTFDDGLKCHYDYVFPELKKRNLWGIFYVPTQPYTEKSFIDVHRIHVLLGKINSKLVHDYLLEIINEKMITEVKASEFKLKTYRTQTNDDYTLIIKQILNYFISYEFRENIISQLMNHFISNSKELFEQFYITPEEINLMSDNNMVIGSHTVHHPVMSRLSKENQEKEIKDSFLYLESIIKNPEKNRTFCYPYGGFHSFNQETEDILNDQNCLYSFNVEQRDISIDDLKNRPQALPRFDCNQFKYGQVKSTY